VNLVLIRQVNWSHKKTQVG